jgi:hypothetical protein
MLDRYPSRTRPSEVLQQFVELFNRKGWLNQTIRIQRAERKYKILCTPDGFMAYRINDNWGNSGGFPGWAVCIVDQNQIIEDLSLTAFPSEPGVLDWLGCLSSGDFKEL